VRELAQALLDYSRKANEPFAAQPAMRADLTWAVAGAGRYVAPQREVAKKPGRKAKQRAAAEVCDRLLLASDCMLRRIGLDDDQRKIATTRRLPQSDHYSREAGFDAAAAETAVA
jgi:hypothetical protein